jgi:hypothetical protein
VLARLAFTLTAQTLEWNDDDDQFDEAMRILRSLPRGAYRWRALRALPMQLGAGRAGAGNVCVSRRDRRKAEHAKTVNFGEQDFFAVCTACKCS